MKKTLLSAGACAAVLMMGLASCSDPIAKESEDKEAVQLGKDMTEILAVQLGDQDRLGLDNGQLPMLRTSFDEYHQEAFDRDAFMRGFKEGMQRDTTEYAYLYGLREGLMVREELDKMAEAYDIRIDYGKFMDEYAKAFTDTLSEEQYQKMQDKMQEMQVTLMTRRQAVQERKRQAQAEANDKAAKEHTAKLLKEGYTKAPSGLIYKVVKPGKGPKVQLNDQVLVNYTGKHINGKEFDSSNGNPVQMSPSGVIQGYRDAMMMLGKGGKILIALPGNLGYGKNGQPAAGIGPNEMLMFELEIVDVLPEEPAESQDPDDAELAQQRAYAQQVAQQMAQAQAAAQR